MNNNNYDNDDDDDNNNNNNDDDEDDDDDDDNNNNNNNNSNNNNNYYNRIQRCNLRFFYNLLTALRTVFNKYVQVARAQSCANRALITCNMSRYVPRGTKEELSYDV